MVSVILTSTIHQLIIYLIAVAIILSIKFINHSKLIRYVYNIL